MSVGDCGEQSTPTKRIISRAHLQAFLESPTHTDLVNFITETNDSVVGHKLTDPLEPSPVSQDQRLVVRCREFGLTDPSHAQAIAGILAVLDRVDQLITDTPPVDNGKSRFGNPAFKDFYDKQQQVSVGSSAARRPCEADDPCGSPPTSQAGPELHALIPNLAPEHIPELSAYFSESWGNRTRVDYGSGMELNLICWLSVPSAHTGPVSATRAFRLTTTFSLRLQTSTAQAGRDQRG